MEATMAQLLLGFVILLAVTVVPVMISARLVGAHKTGFGSAVLALFMQLVLATALLHFGPSPTVALVISILGGAMVYAFALDTTVLRGLVVSILVGLIATVVLFLIAGSVLTGSAILGTP
jgi:hypothetical protein